MKKILVSMLLLVFGMSVAFAQPRGNQKKPLTGPAFEAHVKKECGCQLSRAHKAGKMPQLLNKNLNKLQQRNLVTVQEVALIRQLAKSKTYKEGKATATRLQALAAANSVAAQIAAASIQMATQAEEDPVAYASKGASDAFNTIAAGIGAGALVGGMVGGPQGAAAGAAIGGVLGAAAAAYDEWNDGDEGAGGGECGEGGRDDGGDGGDTGGGGTGNS